MTISTTPDNSFSLRRISSTEQQLVATRSIAEGETVLREESLVRVEVGHYQLTTYVWDLVDILLSNKEKLNQYTRLKLLASQTLLDDVDQQIEAHLVQKHRKSRQFVRTLYCSVATNNVGILDEEMLVRGHGIFPWLSRSDHSCEPNTALTPANWRAGEASLIAKREIRAGEPLTWCYFQEAEFLPQDWITRNYNLVNLYRFTCRCARCQKERPADVPASPAAQVAYIDKLIIKDALEAAKTAEGAQKMFESSPVNLHRERLLASKKS